MKSKRRRTAQAAAAAIDRAGVREAIKAPGAAAAIDRASVREAGETAGAAASPPRQETPSPLRGPFVLWLYIVAGAVVWQPFLLGFYMEDWGACADAVNHGGAFSWARFHFILGIDPSRPTTALIRFLLSSLLADFPGLWQAALLCGGAAIAAALAKAVLSLTPSNGPTERWTVFGVAASWLVLPWCAGFRFWPTLLPEDLLLAAFGLLLYVLFSRWLRHERTIVLPLAIYLILCLGYEAFYFQFIPIILIGVCLALAGRVSRRHVLLSGLALTAAQACAAGWYFLSAGITAAQKPIAPDWPSKLAANLLHLAPALVSSAQEVRWLLGAMLLAATGFVVYALLKALKSPSQRPDAGLTLGLCGCCLVGAGLSVAAFTMGGRPVLGTGVETRVLALFSFWMVAAACVAATFAWRQLAAGARRLFGTAMFGLGLCLVVANLLRAQDWAHAWRAQQRILAEAPTAEMVNAGPDSIVLYVYPLDVGGAPIFAVPWDINHAMPLTHPQIRSLFVIYSPWGGPMVWDGHQLAYADQPAMMKAERLYVWQPSILSFRRAESPFRVNQDYSVEELKPKAAGSRN